MKRFIFCLLTLNSCKCPDPVNGVKQPCVYVGPSVTGSVSFHNVGVGITLWGDPKSKSSALDVPESILNIPIGTK